MIQLIFKVVIFQAEKSLKSARRYISIVILNLRQISILMIYDTTIFGEIYFIFPYGIIMTSSWALMTSYRGMLWSKKFAPPIFVILITQKYHFNHKINLDTKIARNYKSSCTITSLITYLNIRDHSITTNART